MVSDKGPPNVYNIMNYKGNAYRDQSSRIRKTYPLFRLQIYPTDGISSSVPISDLIKTNFRLRGTEVQIQKFESQDDG